MIPFTSTTRLMSAYGRHRRRVFAIIAVLAAGLYFLVDKIGWAHPVEQGYWLRQLFALRGPLREDPGIDIIAFDKTFDPKAYSDGALGKSRELEILANTPGVRYDREIYATVLDRLMAEGAKQVVFDFVFEGPGPTEAGDKALAASLNRHRAKVVSGFYYVVTRIDPGDGIVRRAVFQHDPDERFLAEENPERSLGFVNFWPEYDGTIARTTPRESTVSLSRPEVASKLEQFDDLSLAARAATNLGATVPPGNDSRLVDFAGPARTFPTIPVHLLFTPDSPLPKGRFKDRVVVVGPYSEIHYKGDWFGTPAGFMSGAEIQSNALRGWLRGCWIREPFRGNAAVAPAAVLCLLALLAGLGVPGRRPGLRVLLQASVPVAYLALACLLFSTSGIFLPLVPALAAGGFVLVGGATDFVHSQYERRRIKGIFGAYLAPVVVERIVSSGESPELGGEQVLLTAFFSDIRRFSSFAEKLAPAELVSLMNEYLGEMTSVLEAESGTLDKYVGDGIVAMFGAPVSLPDHAYRACVCAIRMQERLGKLRERWAAAGGFFAVAGSDLRMRIGLNTGVAVVGNMGSAKRFNYTMMGDAVNLASRCEGDAREWAVFTVATKDTVDAARASGEREILFRRLGRHRVKGREEFVDLYEVVGFADAASVGRLACIRAYELGLEAFARGDFAAAVGHFTESERTEHEMPAYRGADGGSPSGLMRRHCESPRESGLEIAP